MTNTMRKYIDLIEYAQNEQREQWTDIMFWDKMPSKYQNRLINAFDDFHEMLDLITGGNADSAYSHYNDNNHEFVYELTDCRDIRKLEVIYIVDKNYIDFRYIESDSPSRTFASAIRILRGLMKFCKKLGITKIKATAGIDGSWQWARIGFYPDNNESMLDHFKNRLKRNIRIYSADHHSGKIPPEYMQKIYDVVDDAGPEIIWQLAENEYGKILLQGAPWEGTLDLTDEKCLERLRRFVRI